MGSDEIHEVLSIKSHAMGSNGVWWMKSNSWDFKYKISWNPMGSDEWNPIHEILSIKSHEIQWDLMKFMRF